MSPDFPSYLSACQARINAALPQYLGAPVSEFADANGLLDKLFESMNYSTVNGGKRVRPLLVYAAAEALGESGSKLDVVAAAVELIHAYSLVHDDLPAMDDDDLRRGQATCHIAFGEAEAILAGDALQTRAFEILADSDDLSSDVKISLIQSLASASGARGMVGGQAIDLGAVNQKISLAHLKSMHQLKTGALIRAAVRMAAQASGAKLAELQALDDYATCIGLSFQVFDDILDVEGSTAAIGKSQGADQALMKPTYPALLGMPEAKAYAQSLHERACASLASFGAKSQRLKELSAYIISRSS